MEERKKGLSLVLDFGSERFNRELGEKDMDWLCETIERIMSEENHRYYTNHFVEDGAEWHFKAKTNAETYECGGSNYYPENLRYFFILLHYHFILPWSLDTHETIREMFFSEEELGEAVDVCIGDKTFPLKFFHDPNEKPEPEDPALEKAKAIALKDDPATDMYTEYEYAYEFFSTAYTATIGPRSLIVMKDTGKSFLGNESTVNLGKQLGSTKLFTGEFLKDDE